MKKLFLLTGTALALGVVANSSYAAAAPCLSTAGTLPGFYVGVGAGYGGMDTPKFNDADKTFGGATMHDSSLRGYAIRGYLGYLWAIPQVQNLQLGAELGGNYYQKNKYDLIAIRGHDKWKYEGFNVDLLGIAKYNFGDTGFNALVKAGSAYVSQKMSVHETNLGAVSPTWAGSKGQFKAEAAAGLGYDINQNVDVNVIYAHIFGNKPGHVSDANVSQATMNKVASVDTLLLTFAYHFGGLVK